VQISLEEILVGFGIGDRSYYKSTSPCFPTLFSENYQLFKAAASLYLLIPDSEKQAFYVRK
jgi:hypothetical protein